MNKIKVKRPLELQGWTWQIARPDSERKLYVTVNSDGKRPVELFIKGNISNGCGILTSTLLQTGYPVKDVCRKLNQITGTHHIPFNGKVFSSEEQIVAECLQIAHARLSEVQPND